LFDAIERESKRVTPGSSIEVLREVVVVRLYAAEKGGGRGDERENRGR